MWSTWKIVSRFGNRTLSLCLHLFDSIYLYYDENQRKQTNQRRPTKKDTIQFLFSERTAISCGPYSNSTGLCTKLRWAMNFKFQFLFSHCNRSKNYFQATECNSLCRWPFLLCLLNRNDILLLSDTNTNKCNTKTTVLERKIDLHISNIKHLRLVPVPSQRRWSPFYNGILSVWQTLLSFCWISSNFLYTWNMYSSGILIAQFWVFQQICVKRKALDKIIKYIQSN